MAMKQVSRLRKSSHKQLNCVKFIFYTVNCHLNKDCPIRRYLGDSNVVIKTRFAPSSNYQAHATR